MFTSTVTIYLLSWDIRGGAKGKADELITLTAVVVIRFQWNDADELEQPAATARALRCRDQEDIWVDQDREIAARGSEGCCHRRYIRLIPYTVYDGARD